jgi:hypothetical protein
MSHRSPRAGESTRTAKLDRQLVLAVDHLLALSNPALVSTPSKKSFSRVNWPIFACSVFPSTAASAGSAFASPPKTPAAPSSYWLFHGVIWLACTSNCCANSVRGFSPSHAARATFALNAAVWFRRERLLMPSPVSGHLRPVQTRPSTFPWVQFSRATPIPLPCCRYLSRCALRNRYHPGMSPGLRAGHR